MAFASGKTVDTDDCHHSSRCINLKKSTKWWDFDHVKPFRDGNAMNEWVRGKQPINSVRGSGYGGSIRRYHPDRGQTSEGVRKPIDREHHVPCLESREWPGSAAFSRSRYSRA